MLEALKRLKDSFLRGLPWLLLFVGVFLLVLSTLGFKEPEHADYRELLKAAGIAVLTGGVFGAILKSLQYMGV